MPDGLRLGPATVFSAWGSGGRSGPKTGATCPTQPLHGRNEMSASHRIRAVAGVVTALFLYAAAAVAGDGEAQKILAPTGKLRAALYPGTPTSILDPKESEPRGVGYELGKELARRLGVPYAPVVFR